MSFGSWPRFADFPDFWTDLSFGHVFGLLPGGVCDFFLGGEGTSSPCPFLCGIRLVIKSFITGGVWNLERQF